MDANNDRLPIDPRLTEGTVTSPGRVASQGNVPGLARGQEGEVGDGLPASRFAALDQYLAGHAIADPSDRAFYLGVQHGIGLGISETRDAILDEMAVFGTAFGRPMELLPHDEDHMHMQRTIADACTRGFDLRAAYRAARTFIAALDVHRQTVIENGLVNHLPGNEDCIVGSGATFSEEDVVRCHENRRVRGDVDGRNPFPGIAIEEEQPAQPPTPPPEDVYPPTAGNNTDASPVSMSPRQIPYPALDSSPTPSTFTYQMPNNSRPGPVFYHPNQDNGMHQGVYQPMIGSPSRPREPTIDGDIQESIEYQTSDATSLANGIQDDGDDDVIDENDSDDEHVEDVIHVRAPTSPLSAYNSDIIEAGFEEY